MKQNGVMGTTHAKISPPCPQGATLLSQRDPSMTKKKDNTT